MPITKQVIKRMKQAKTAQTRNKHYGSRMKSLMKLVLGYVETGEMEKAKKMLPEVIKSIDTAAKKNIIHSKNADHKKSRIQRAINIGPSKKVEKKPSKTVKREVSKVEKEKVEKAVEVKEAPKTEEKA